ncbi:MAG: hypothetical protein NTZ73_02440 [Candidatus Diapherotrites archaeon]|nr:hypothetical protein [Candidatus Diapherotrites archaeon]
MKWASGAEKKYLQNSKVESAISSPRTGKIALFFATILFVLLLFFLTNASLPKITAYDLGAFALLFAAYYAIKGFAFQQTFAALAQKISFTASLKSFFVSDFVELVSFSGKLGGDASKFLIFRNKVSQKELLVAIILFRVIGVASLAATVALFVLWEAKLFGLIAAISLGALVATAVYFKTTAKNEKHNYFRLAISFAANTVCQVLSVLTMLLAAIIFGIPITSLSWLVGAFIVSRSIGIVTLLPFGFVTQDVSFSIYLAQFLDVQGLISFNAFLRIVSVLPSTIIGWFIVSKKISETKKQR